MKFPGYVDIDAYFISIMTLFFLYNQGSGKTTLAKKLARAWKCELINGKYSVMKVPLSLRNTKYKYPQLVMQHCFKFWVDVLHFSPCMINLSRNKNVCCRPNFGFLVRFLSKLELVMQQICSSCATSWRWRFFYLVFCRVYPHVGWWTIVCYSCHLFYLCFHWIQFKEVSQFLALSRFGTLAEFCTVTKYSFGSLVDCWAC